MSTDTISLRRLEWLLSQRGYRYWKESEISQVLPLRTTIPDFLVEWSAGKMFLLEAKAFERETVLHRATSRVLSLGHMTLQKRINRLVADAAAQTSRYDDYGLPIVVALDNWRQVGLPIGTHGLRSLLGERQIVQTVNIASGEVLETGVEHVEDHSPLHGGRNSHVSAVFELIATTRFDTLDSVDSFLVERPMKVRILRNPFAAHPLSREVFSHSSDEAS